MVGKIISHYKIIEKLGEGGMGKVYLAEDTKLKRQVAIKLLPSRLTVNETDKARFFQEAQAAAAINHPNVCVIHDIKEHDNVQFIVMEYVEGQTLSDIIASKPLPIEQVVEYAIQIGSALQAAHEKNIVHRDIKSDNIMVTKTGQIKVMDFGLAKLRGSIKLTKSTSTVGTLAYMSPEQIEGKEIDVRADIFSFGVVLYEMLTGKLPFRGEYESSLIYSILNEEPEPVIKFRPDLSSDFLHVINRVLEKNPEDRYHSMKDVLIELRRLKRDSSRVSQKLPQESLHQSKRTKKIPRLNLAAVVISILILTVVSIYIFSPFSITPERPMKIIPFTTLAGQETEPAFSPDGNTIAFSWNGETEDNYDIYVKTIGSDTPLRLTNHKGDDWSPEWSPDGQFIAFCRSHEGEIGIYNVSVEGGTERRLHSGSWKGLSNLSWSPDNQFIAISGKFSTKEPYSIYLLSLKQLELKKLTSPPLQYRGDYDCSFSSDGKMIAFNREVSEITGDIYLMPISGGEPIRLTFDNSWIAGLTWTQDGSEIVFSSNRGGMLSLWRISAKGGKAEPLAFSGQFIEYPVTSLKGNKLAYVDWSYNENIYRMDINKQKDNPLIPQRFIFSSRPDWQADFSPDGSKIAFASWRSGTFEIWTCDSTGRNPVQITSIGGPLGGTPRWSPDGSMIVFDARQEGHSDIFLVNAEGRAHRRITTSESDDTVPCWSADGKWIYFASNRSGELQIWRTPSNEGNPSQVTVSSGFAPRISSDSNWVYYSRRERSAIFKCPAEGGKETIVYDFPLYWTEWCLADDGIYYLNQREGNKSIEFFNFHTNKSTKIANVDIKGDGWPIVSPNGQWLLITQEDQNECDIILVENFQ